MEQKVEIFLCYARKDQAMLNDLKIHLVPMVRLDLINMWHDADISPGTAWEEEEVRELACKPELRAPAHYKMDSNVSPERSQARLRRLPQRRAAHSGECQRRRGRTPARNRRSKRF